MLGNVRGGTPDETHWNLTSQASGGGITGSTFFMETGKWYNAFLIYEQNTALTLAIDDGTTFDYLRSTDVPGGFDTITNGFGDALNSWAMAPFRPHARARDARIALRVLLFMTPPGALGDYGRETLAHGLQGFVT